MAVEIFTDDIHIGRRRNGVRVTGGGGGTPSWETEALAWQTAVVANSGTTSSETLQAVQDFLEDVTIAGIRAKLLRLNLFAGDQLAAALVPQIRDAGNVGADANTRFVGGDFAEATGLNPGSPNNNNAAYKFLDTGLNLLTVFGSAASFAQGFWASNAPNPTTAEAMMGAYNTVFAYLRGYTSGYRMADMYGTSTANGSRVQYGTGQTNKAGLLSASRVSTTDFRLYEAGVQVASNTAAWTGTAPDATLRIFHGPAADQFTDLHCSQGSYGYFVAHGLTNDEMANLHLAWDTFNDALGRS